MTKDELIEDFYKYYEELKTVLKSVDIDRIRELSLEVHAMVHLAEVSGKTDKTIAGYALESIRSGEQNRVVSRETCESDLHYAGTKQVPLCWQLWHTYRIEDLVSNILMANQNQVFTDGWQRKIGSTTSDTGNALEFDEAVAWGKGIDVYALREYLLAVGRNTREILRNLTLEQVRSMVPEERVMRILEVGGVTTDFRSMWLLVFWGRLTGGGMILTPITGHHMMHLPQCV